ncbi:MAG: hypothetical protein COA58_07710 [Bacteroidetes bacterium]|nr:MAG: hypothetical protein COA58_07710 [Bacteroidota bacterium]
MNFLKWFGYIILCAAFIWFVFFKPFNYNTDSAGDNNDTNEIEVEDSNSTDLVEDTYTYSDNFEDGDSISDYSDIDDESTDNFNDVVSDDDNITDNIDVSTPEENNTSSGGSINLESKYLIVVGSFGNKSNADRMLLRVNNDQNYGRIVLIRGLHRVVTASTDDQTDAINLRNHFTHVYKEQAFILKQ